METPKGFKKSTFGELNIGDTFNVPTDGSIKSDLEFFKRVKISKTDCKYADDTPMFIAEDHNPPDRVIFIRE